MLWPYASVVAHVAMCLGCGFSQSVTGLDQGSAPSRVLFMIFHDVILWRFEFLYSWWAVAQSCTVVAGCGCQPGCQSGSPGAVFCGLQPGSPGAGLGQGQCWGSWPGGSNGFTEENEVGGGKQTWRST